MQLAQHRGIGRGCCVDGGWPAHAEKEEIKIEDAKMMHEELPAKTNSRKA